jgi:hypothetical protein
MTDAWDGRPQNPERDGWHWLQWGSKTPEVLYWDVGMWWDTEGRYREPSDFTRCTYLGPCLTPYEIEARVIDAAAACSAAWRAAPEGEGVVGAEYFAELAAAVVLREGKTAEEACAEVFARGGTYGGEFLHVLIRKGEVEARIAEARRAALEDAAQYLEKRKTPRWGSPSEHAAAIRALKEKGDE